MLAGGEGMLGARLWPRLSQLAKTGRWAIIPTVGICVYRRTFTVTLGFHCHDLLV